MKTSRRNILRGSASVALAASVGVPRARAQASRTITLLTFESLPSSQAVLRAHAAQFEKENPGVKINISFSSGEAVRTQIASMLQAGTPPDAAVLPIDDTLLYARNGILSPITSIVDALGSVPDKFRARIDGQDYYVPQGMKFTYAWYRSDLIQQPPRTWAEFESTASKLTGGGKYGFVVSSAEAFDYPVSQMFSFAFSNGVEFVDDAGNVIFDKGASKDAFAETLSFLKRMSKYSPSGANIQWGAAIDAYASGQVAMVSFIGARLLAIVRQNNPAVGQVTKPMIQPYGKAPGATLGTQGYLLFAGGKNGETTEAFLRALCTKERMLEFAWSTQMHVVPADKETFLGEYQNNEYVRANPEVTKTITECWDTGYVSCYDAKGKRPNWQRVRLYTSTVYNKIIADVIQGGVEPNAAIDAGAAAARRLLSRG